ncbi:MAG: response regulator [Pseudomonadota bacterium]
MTEKLTHKILYIEDSPANRQLVQFIVERKQNLTISVAADGKSGIEAAKREVPDLVLLDISLPDMTGYAVLAALRSDPVTAKIPVVAISGEFPAKLPDNTPYLFERYLPKPIEIGPLYQTIDELLQT